MKRRGPSTLGALERRYNVTRKLAEEDSVVAIKKAQKMKQAARRDTIKINPEKPDLTARPIN